MIRLFIHYQENGAIAMKKRLIAFVIMIVALILGFIVIMFISPFSAFAIKGIRDAYSFEDFVSREFGISAPFFVNKDNTIWTVNGYDFSQGRKTSSIPVNSGDNVISIKNGDRTVSYTVYIDTTGTLLIPELAISEDDMDYARDGLGNAFKKELGLSTYRRDSAGDGLYDNVKLAMGLDPLLAYDYNEVREYAVFADYDESTGIYLEISGIGNIANTFVDSVETGVLGVYGVFVKSNVVRISTTNSEKPESMRIVFKNDNGKYRERYNAIYKFDAYAGNIEEIETIFTETEVYANVDSFNLYYLIGDKRHAPFSMFNQIFLLIDNSGSMFSIEHVEKNYGREMTDEEKAGVGNDVDFNRLTLMNEVVASLGTEDYAFAVAAFTGNYYKLSGWSMDADEINSKIDSLRTECQVFNGTALYNSISRAVKDIDEKQYGAKFLIVLTDGENQGGRGFSGSRETSDKELEKIKGKGVRIISIGLGDDLDFSYLQKIAAQTNGKYIHAKDSNALTEILDLLRSAIQNLFDQVDGNKAMIVGDSGFRPMVDGFSFINFVALGMPNGNCYGFSNVAKEIYLSRLKMSDTAVSGSNMFSLFKLVDAKDMALVAYDLTEPNRARLTKGNLYTGVVLDEWYSKYVFHRDWEHPDDYWTEASDVAVINERYRHEFTQRGIIPITKSVNDPVTFNVDGDEKELYKQESIIGCLNCFDADIADEVLDDYQVLQLINRNQRSQIDVFKQRASSKNTTSSPTFDEFVFPLMLELQSGSPAMLGVVAQTGGHMVLGTKLYWDAELDKFYLYIYDCNVPGVDNKATLTREVTVSVPLSPHHRPANVYDLSVSSTYVFEYSAGGHDFTKIVYDK